MEIRTTINTLGYAGLIPFSITAGLIWFEISTPIADELFAFASYSALILSFLAGILWGRSLGAREETKPVLTLISSNAFVLLAWLCLLLLSHSPVMSLALLAAGFVILLTIERGLLAELFPGLHHYYKYFRFSLTALVVAAHILVLVALTR
ncbi:MAG: DUF3429 domain-containing protein [Pseudomonadales bacterium]|nr:DUF3429 domain-containing protein [Pseudomonadales bacterium]